MLLSASFLMLAAALHLHSQSPPLSWEKAAGSQQQFDVASVHENKNGGPSHSNFSLDNGNGYFTIGKDDILTPSGSLFSAENQSLLRYIIFAYKLSGTQELALRFGYFKGLESPVPGWVRNSGFDIEARAPQSTTKDQMRLMMQSLLAERFKLAVHFETREAPVFALELAKAGSLGPQLQKHQTGDDCAEAVFPTGPRSGATAKQPQSAIPIPCGELAHLPPSAPGANRFGGRDVPLSLLATSLPTQTGMAVIPRPVIDKTGLEGNYDFSIEWTPEDTSEVNNQESGGTFQEALKEQLGLKLQPEKGPVEVLVIDHVEPPSPN
jgi:uncharacterized protein (TIGR03435 family)